MSDIYDDLDLLKNPMTEMEWTILVDKWNSFLETSVIDLKKINKDLCSAKVLFGLFTNVVLDMASLYGVKRKVASMMMNDIYSKYEKQHGKIK